MTLTYKFHADWDQDGYFCIEATPDDPLNRVTTPLTWTDWTVTASAGGSVVQGGDDFAYGLLLSDWTSGTNTTAYVQHGGALDSIAGGIDNSSPYTLIFWIQSFSASYDAIPLEVSVYNASNALITTSSAFTVTQAEGWKKIAVSFTTLPSGNGVFFRVGKVSSATSIRMSIAGLMVVDGTYTTSSAPDFNVGHASNGYDNLLPFLMDARWSVGASRAYADVADLNVFTLTLDNSSKAFSPENTSSGLNGLMSDRYLRVRAKSALSIERTMFFGYIQSVQPHPGATGPYTAVLTATSSRRYWEGKQVQISLQTSKRADQVISALEAEITRPPSPLLVSNLDVGTYTWAYAGDNWEDGVDALAALGETVRAERGFAYWAREDTLVFKNREWRYDFADQVTTLSATITDAQAEMDYDYGFDLMNDVAVTFYPRKLGASTTALLWELQESISIPPSSSETIFARYTNGDQDSTVGAVPGTVAVGTFTTSGGTINHSLSAKAQGCIITLTNPSASVTRTVTAMTLTGQRISAFNKVTVSREDTTSINEYGRRTTQHDLRLVNARADARQIAQLEIDRFKDPKGHVRRITIGRRNATFEQYMVDLRVGFKIRVIETQTAHDGQYMIVGERHEITDALQTHRVTYILEPAIAVV